MPTLAFLASCVSGWLTFYYLSSFAPTWLTVIVAFQVGCLFLFIALVWPELRARKRSEREA